MNEYRILWLQIVVVVKTLGAGFWTGLDFRKGGCIYSNFVINMLN